VEDKLPNQHYLRKCLRQTPTNFHSFTV